MLPLFPLHLVAFPGEILNLHIFEPRYRQLINECLDEGKHFGIPTFLNDALPGYGCEMEITNLVERYDDGRMDIHSRGIRVFQTKEMQNPLPGKLYAGAEVDFWDAPEAYPDVLPALQEKVERLYQLLQSPLKADINKPQPYSYQIGHLIGLHIDDEYELLTLQTEFERQEFLLAHLSMVIPMMEDMERTRERIQMNGHFREFDPLNF